MDLSYWEKKEWFNNIDTLIIGSGIVGLCSAIEILKKNPNQNLLILEKGFLPQGASTKNAGFACFGSPTEIFDDQKIIFDDCYEKIEYLNKLLNPIFKKNVFSIIETPYNFKNTLKKCIYNPFEAQLDVGVMMKNLISNTESMGGKIITGITVKKVNENGKVKINDDFIINNK